MDWQEIPKIVVLLGLIGSMMLAAFITTVVSLVAIETILGPSLGGCP